MWVISRWWRTRNSTRGAVVGVEAHAAGDRPHHVGADFGMAAAEALADIVKHQAQIKQLDLFRLAGELSQQGQAFGVVAGAQSSRSL